MARGEDPVIGVGGYPDATLTPSEAGLTPADIPRVAPLPSMDYGDLPSVPAHPVRQNEPMVPLRGVLDLATYHRAGWPDARPAAVARAEAVDRLAIAVHALPPGFGLAVFDAWRPLILQRRIFDHFYGPGSGLEEGFVSVPSPSPTTPPPHLTGGTFDLTLTWRGLPLSLGTDFDEFTTRAHTAALEAESTIERDLRRLLVASMMGAGFVAYAAEWWHFEFGTRRWAAHEGVDPCYGVTAP